MYQCCFINSNKCTTEMQDVNNSGNCEGDRVLQQLPVLPAQFLCKSNTVLKYSLLKKESKRKEGRKEEGRREEESFTSTYEVPQTHPFFLSLPQDVTMVLKLVSFPIFLFTFVTYIHTHTLINNIQYYFGILQFYINDILYTCILINYIKV